MSFNLNVSINDGGFIKALFKGKEKTAREIAALAKSEGNETLENYQKNLSGSQPSTSSSPLPVGIVTGELRSSASIVINDKSFVIFNSAEHAGWIELGTVKMAPRRPLGDAFGKLDRRILKRMDGVMNTIWG